MSGLLGFLSAIQGGMFGGMGGGFGGGGGGPMMSARSPDRGPGGTRRKNRRDESKFRGARGMDASPWQTVAMGGQPSMDPYTRKGMNSQVMGWS